MADSKVYSSSFYTTRGQTDTANATDNVFANSLSEQMATVTGNIKEDFTPASTIVVKA